MKSVLLLVCLLGVSRLSAEYVFLPSAQEAYETGGYGRSNYPAARFGLLEAIASSLATSGFKPASPKSSSTFTAAAPFCLACTCKVGRTTCASAGGISYVTSGSAIGMGVSVTCSSDQPCVAEAPTSMSACDPACRKRTSTCDPNVDPSQLKCTERVYTSVCGTDCEFRNYGEKVVCNQQAIVQGVINDIPRETCSQFGRRKRRNSGYQQRQGRYLKLGFAGSSTSLLATTVSVQDTALFSYAPTGRCIPNSIADAPRCTRLS